MRDSCIKRRIPLISAATEQYLIQYCISYHPNYIVEFGAAVWYSTCVLQSCISQRGWSIISIESSYPHYSEAVNNCRMIINPQSQGDIRIYHGAVLDMPRWSLLDRPVDMIFIDARKSEYGDYLTMIEWRRNQQRCAPNICIILDDVVKYKSKMSSLYEYLDKKQIIFQIHQLDEDDGIMVIWETNRIST